MEFSSAGPIVGLFLAGIFAAAAWWLGLVMTKHPLLAQIRLAASSIASHAEISRLGRGRQSCPGEKCSREISM